MRKVLLFVLLFGAGFALLWWTSRERDEPKGGDTGSETRTGPGSDAQGPFTEIPVRTDGAQSSGESKQGPIGIRLSGPVRITQRKTIPGTTERRVEIELASSDVRAVTSDEYEMRDLSVDVYEPLTGRKRAELRSPRSNVHVAIVEGLPRISGTEPVRLTDADVTLHEGGPVVPLRVRVPVLDWRVEANTFTSTERVRADGTGLVAEGTGLDADATKAHFELKRDAWIDLTLADGRTARLASGREDGIVLQRVDAADGERVDLVARGGARLDVRAAPPGKPESERVPVSIAARTIHVLGRKVGAGDVYEIVTADAEGDVVTTGPLEELRAQDASFRFGPNGRLLGATLDGAVRVSRARDLAPRGPAEVARDTFTAEHAEFEFEATGQLVSATLTGSPSGDVHVGRFAGPSRPEFAGETARVTGQGPLVLTRRAGNVLDFTGPARLELPGRGFVLDASERIVGTEDPARRRGDVLAQGTVVVSMGENRMQSDGLELGWSDAGGAPAIVATTNGRTTLDGRDERGRVTHTIAQRGLRARAVERNWVVDEAREVETSSPEEGVTASARLVRAFDPVRGSFVAEGDVRFDSPRGNGRAQRVDARSREDVTLEGVPGAPATFDFSSAAAGVARGLLGDVKALSITARPDHVVARGDVEAHVETKDGRLDASGGELDLELAPEDVARPHDPRPFRVRVRGAAHATIRRGAETAEVRGNDLVVAGTVRQPATAGAKPVVETNDVRGDGDVHVEYRGEGLLVGDGDHVTYGGDGSGRLWADPGRRVRANGRFAGSELPYAIEADWVEFDREHVEAAEVRMRLEAAAEANADPAGAAAPRDGAVGIADASAPRTAAFDPANDVARTTDSVYRPIAGPAAQDGPDAMPAQLHEFRAKRVRADRGELLLSGDAHVDGVTRQGEPWLIEAETIRMRGDFRDARKLQREDVASVDAEGGFVARMGERLSATGASLHAVPGRVELTGSPAHLEVMQADWESTKIAYDLENMLLSTDTGAVRARVGSPGTSWSIEYESLQPFDQDDDTILVLRNPRLRFGSRQLRADWMLFWVDRDEWRRSGRDVVSQTIEGAPLRVTTPGETRPNAPAANSRAPFDAPDVMARMGSSPTFQVLSEAYVEGNIEVFDQGERAGRAHAIYLDVKDQQGWVQDADVVVDVRLRGFDRKLRAKAAWMRISPGPTLHASDAEITSCDYDTPHYVVETSDLRMTPKRNDEDQRVAYDVSARGNSLRFENGLRLPLPPLVYETDDEGKPLVDRFVLGNSAKYGAAVRATLNAELGPVGEAAGHAIAKVLRIPDADIRGNWRYNVGILGSRGVLLGLGLDLRAGDRFKMLAEVDGIPDRRGDRGLVRVEEDDRALLRTWFRTKARFTTGPGEWFDLALSTQSDPGVQSEFFERDYLRYERKDNYLHWRKARDSWYGNASVKWRFDDRRDVEELPSVGGFLGRTQIGEWFENPVYYDGRADFAWLRRHDGDARYYRPFEDGLGDRDVRRFDTEHRLEAPFDLGVLAARGTPYVKARGTLWSEGADPDLEPHRLALIVGFDATTTFWRRNTSGSIHTISPSIGVHEDVVSEESGGDLVRIDQVEDPIEGRFVDFGVRSRWWRPDTLEKFDVDVRGSYGSQLPDGQRSGLQPLAVLGEFLTYKGDVPIGLTHDGRYDTNTGNTTYSLTSLGFEPWENVGLEFGYQRGLATVGQERLFESASVAARWRWTTKWEMEVGQSYAIASDTGVGNEFVLRRLGHDFIVEFEVAFRSGEGSTFAINFQPAIAWRRSGLGLLDRWLGVYH